MTIVLVVQKLIYKQYFNSNTRNILVLTEHKPCIIHKLFLSFSDSWPEYSYKLYSYKKVCTMS